MKVSSITALSNDIMRSLKAESVRIVAPVPGKNTVGIEVPNAQKEKVRLKELMQLAPEAMQQAWRSRCSSARTPAASRSSPTWPRCPTA